MPLYRDEGVVLRTHKLGEADRIITIFSQGHGKVRGVAKGVRRSGSKFGGRLEPTSHIAFQAFRGRGDLDTITQVETIDAFRQVREDYDRFTHVIPMLEAVDQVVPEREAIPPIHRMLVGALRTVDREPAPLVTPAFVWKLLSLEGFHPSLHACVRCGAQPPVDDPESFPSFDVGGGGVLCSSCAVLGGVRCSPVALELVRMILGGELSRALQMPTGPAAREVERLAVTVLEFHLERRLRSAALL